jgi:hypothetical protein
MRYDHPWAGFARNPIFGPVIGATTIGTKIKTTI